MSATAPRILLLGANGQVGFELQRSLSPLGELRVATRTGVLPGGADCLRADLADRAGVLGLLESQRPQLIVNAAAYTAVDRAEDEAELALRINGEAVGELAQWCADQRARLVHFSTDYVFAGTAGAPYREDAATGPVSAYGRSKLVGEELIRASGCDHLILRTAWVYAARGGNFLRTMLRLGHEREELGIVDDQRGAPTAARFVADATALALARGGGAGTYHLAAGGQCSWHGFAEAIFAAALQAGLLARIPRLRPLATAEFPTRAVRPADSRLDSSRFAATFGLHIPEWRQGLGDVIAELAEAAGRSR